MSSLLAGSTATAFPVGAGNRANDVIGHADFTTGFVDFAIDPFFGGATSSSRMFVPNDVAYDDSNERVFVADVHNHRFLVFDASAGITDGLAASFVLGQPDFVTGGADSASPFGHANTANAGYGCTTAINACGVARAMAVAYDAGNDRLFAADPDNHRVLVWNLAAGIANGMPAANVLGQASFTTGARNTACGGGAAGTTNACGLAFPSSLAFDAASQRLYVADTDNHRVVVFDLAAGVRNGMAATAVLGQASFATATAGSGARGMASPIAVSLDGNGRLFVSELDNHRITQFAVTTLTSGMAAAHVLGQPDFTTTTANTACGGGASGETNTNACGIGIYGADLAFDPVHDVLFASDAANQRILTFDASTIVDGERATGVLGQPDFTTGYDPDSVTLGGTTSRGGLLVPGGLDYDAVDDRLIAADGGNHRLEVFGANVGGEPVAVAGNDAATTTTADPTGSVTVDITSSAGDTFAVVLPPGTTPLPGKDITITVDDAPNANHPRIRVEAKLPPGTTKTISIPRMSGRRLCVNDKTLAEFVQSPTGQCLGDVFQGPTAGCMNRDVSGDPGDNNSPTGRHTIVVCLDASRTHYLLSGLLHSAVEVLPDDPQPDDARVDDLPPLDPAAPDAVEVGGCDAGGGQAGLALALILAATLIARSRSTARSRVRASGSRR